MKPSQEPTLNYQQWFAGGDIFYRQTDRQRLDDAIRAMVAGDRGIAVIADHETVLDHYGRMLLARLREQKKFQLEVLAPTDTESLLQRFNKLVAALSLQQATEHADPSTLVKLLVINDPSLIKHDQWTLMERLLSDFPGVNVRLILLINKTGYADYQRPLDLLGRKLHRWLVESPSAQEAQQLLQAAREYGYGTEVETLLLQTGLGDAVGLPQSAPETDPCDTSIEALAETAIELDSEPSADSSPAYPDHQPSDSSIPRAALGMALILIIASAAVVWQLTAHLRPAGVTTELSIVAQPHQLPLAKNILASIEPGLSVGNLPPKQTRQSPPDRASLLPEVAVTEQPPVTVEAQLQIAEPVVVTAVDIVNNSDPGDFFVQYIVLSDRDPALKFIQRYPQLKQAFVLPIQVQQTVGIAVLSGPFDSRLAAEEYAKGRDLAADYWVRGAGQLKTAIATD